MKPRADKLEKIDQFLSGQLEGDELDVFKAKMEQDPAFTMLVEAQRKANELVVGHRLFEVKEMMSQDFQSGRVKTGNNIGYWAAGVVLVALISSSVFYLIKPEKNQKEISHVQASLAKSASPENIEVENKSKSIPEPTKLGEPKEAPEKIKPTTGEEQKVEGMIITPQQDQKHEEASPAVKSFTSMNKVSDTTGVEVNSNIKVKNSDSPKIKCPEIAPEADLQIERTCEGKENGSVIVDLKDQNSNYLYMLHTTGADTIRSRTGNFSFLKAGSYTLTFKDSETGCITSFNTEVKVENKPCIQTRTFSFSPSYNEVLKIPVQKDGKILIFEKSGREVFSDIFNGHDLQWNGLDKSGVSVSPGVYIYIIEYSDGNKEKGDIAVY